MNVITGTGAAAWAGRRLILETDQGETLGAEVITAQLTYGALGTCQGGTLTLAEYPLNWETRAYSRLVRLKLESEHGTGYVFVGVLETVTGRAGQLAQVNLIAPHRLILGRLGKPEGVSSAIQIPGLTAGERRFGAGLDVLPLPHQTLEEVYNRVMESHPDGDLGVGPDLYAAIGYPGGYGLTPHTAAVGEADYVIESEGVRVTNYVTDAVFSPGDGWTPLLYSRTVPALVPRRTAPATANPATVTVPETVQTSGYQRMSLSSTPERWQHYPDWTVQRRAREWKRQSCKVRVRYELVMNLPENPVTLSLRVRRPPGVGDIYHELKIALAGVWVQEWDIPAELWEAGGQVAYFELLATSLPSGTAANELQILEFGQVSDIEYPNLEGVEMPDGWNAPVSTEPSYRLTEPGWLVPPLVRSQLPGGKTQWAAGSTVTWHRGECSTVITTAAWPYPGQKRGG